MKNDFPKVSILIPVYNGSNYLAEAIECALNQTYKNIEIIVINDGSTDGGASRNIAMKYGEQIIYLEKENGGVASALNLGIRHMEGDYFSWLSHDDRYYADKIKKQVDFLNKVKNEHTILYTDYDLIDANGVVFNRIHLKPIDPKDFWFELMQKSFLHGCSLLIPRRCFEEFGVFNEQLRATQDYELWFRFMDKYDFVNVPEILVSGREHANQVTKRLPKLIIEEDNLLYINQLKKKKDVLQKDQLLRLCISFLNSGRFLASIAAKNIFLKKFNNDKDRWTVIKFAFIAWLKMIKNQPYLFKIRHFAKV